MTTTEKICAYLDRLERYLDTPWSRRDPAEYETLMAMKEEIYAESESEKGDCHETVL